MSKYIKRYNKTTGEWEKIISPDVNIHAYLPDGSKITDQDVIIVNKSGDTLDNTLANIDENIARLQRNVSWLAEHGGNGGGSGSGSTVTSYGIVLDTPVLQNGNVYTTVDTLDVTFHISGGSENDICKYSYTFDGTASGYKEVYVNEGVNLKLDISDTFKTTHLLTINAINPFNNTIAPLTFYIYKSSFSVINDTTINIPNAIFYSQGIYNVSYTYREAFIPINLQCGLLGANVAITSRWNDKVKTFEFKNETTEIQKINLNVWEMIADGTITPGTNFIIDFTAQATFEGLSPLNADPFRISVKIINPNELTVVLSVNAVSSAYDITVPLNDSLSYSFALLGPTVIPTVYYAAKIEKNGIDPILINGSYYDDNTKIEGATYKDNSYTTINNTVTSNYTISDTTFSVNDKIKLYVKAWSYDGTYVAESYAQLIITEENNEIYARQFNANEMFVSCNRLYNIGTDKQTWKSTIDDYNFMDISRSGESSVVLTIDTHDSNENSGLITSEENPVLHMRLQNHAYATMDFSKYAQEIAYISGANNRVYNRGFNISLTYSIDYNANTQQTVFLWGTNFNETNEISEGFRINVNKVYWRFIDGKGSPHTLTANVSYNKKNTVDFVYRKDIETAFIYVNGTPNAAMDLSDLKGLSTNVLPNIAYFGCNYYRDNICDYADINIYEFSVYTSALNDLQMAVNGKNARLNGLSNNLQVIEDYKLWKKKNLIYNQDDKVLSYLFKNGKFIKEFDANEVNYIRNNSNIPSLTLRITDERFTKEFFYKRADTRATKIRYKAVATYYAPSTETSGGTACEFEVEISLQGTSTLGYRIKNLEMYLIGTFTDEEGNLKEYLFQPKENWFPENEFTLKADVVDSSHANNTVIGEWINNNTVLFDNNPAMGQLNENTRPKDIDLSGNTCTSIVEGKTIDYYNDVTIKHTIEGFPVLLFIQFPNESNYNLIGIYSFNLGRYSYYNLGMKFLDAFCRRNESGNKIPCPAVIKRYKEKTQLGNINSDDIFSYEFSENAVNENYPLWSQYNTSILKNAWGEMRYPENLPDTSPIWGQLSSLFELVAKSPTGNYRKGERYTKFDGIMPYYYENGQMKQDGNTPISQSTDNYTKVYERIRNAEGYFIASNAVGLSDSLGKNATLRTWDGGDTWWFCFYDLDTGLALKNTGAEDIPSNCGIDKYTCISNPLLLETKTEIIYHDVLSDYAAYNAKIWGLLRDIRYIYEVYGGYDKYPYEELWGKLRGENGPLSTSEKFVTLMESKVNTCGELVYSSDYNSKYIEKTKDTVSALNFLHGTRIEFVRDWLRRHLYYLDGVFDIKELNMGVTTANSDCPLYNDNFAWAFYIQGKTKVPFVIQVSTPSFITLNTNNVAVSEKYFIPVANEDFIIYYPNTTAANTQTVLYGSTLLTKFNGLQDSGFMQISNSTQGALYGLTEFDVSRNYNLIKNNPLHSLSQLIKDGTFESNLETLNLSNTRCKEPVEEYALSLTKFNKLLNIDIHDSDVTALALPETNIHKLSLYNTKISNLRVDGQNIIDELNLTNCNKLQTLYINNCNNISELNINSLNEISDITILNCDKLDTIVISNNNNLKNVTISDNINLKKITFSNCNNEAIKIKITGCKPESISFTNLRNSKNPIILPEDCSEMKEFYIQNMPYCGGLLYGDKDTVEEYENGIVLNLRPLSHLEDGKLLISLGTISTPNTNVTALRVANIKDHPTYLGFNGIKNIYRIFGHFVLKNITFNNCNNFFLREEEKNDSGVTIFYEEPYFDEKDNATNITIEDEILNGVFASTNCTLTDVYYVLQKCENVIDISYLFNKCNNIKIDDNDPLNEKTFSKCGKVERMNELFTLVKGPITPSLIAPMTALTEYNYCFGHGTIKPGQYDALYEYYINNKTGYFFPEGCKITKLVGFNPRNKDWYDFENAFSEILYNLKDVITIEDSFNMCWLNGSKGGSPYMDELFTNCEKIEYITNSFNNIKLYGDVVISGPNDLFGICNCNKEDYKATIKGIQNSFSFVRYFIDDTDDNEEGNTLILKLTNNLFEHIAPSIESISSNNDSNGNSFIFGEMVEKELDITEGIPYFILSGCTNLVKIQGLFKDTIIKENIKPIEFPTHELFEGCPNLKDFSFGFENFKVPCKLVSESFNGTQIERLEGLFRGAQSIVGCIPYRFFYNENILINNLDSTFANLNSSAMTSYECTDEDFKHHLYTEKGILNEYLADGSRAFYEKVEGVLGLTTSAITDIEEILSNLNDKNDNLLIYPLQKIYKLQNGDIIEWCKDSGKTIINEALEDSGETIVEEYQENRYYLSRLDSIGNIYIENRLPESYYPRKITDINYTDLGLTQNEWELLRNYHDSFKDGKYMCPPDLLLYCVNNDKTIIDGIFNHGGKIENDKIFGLRGRIPENLLKPVSELYSVNDIFNKLEKTAFATEWGNQTSEGTLLPPTLFSYFRSLNRLTNVFSGWFIWGKTKLPENLFNIPSLTNISGLFSNVTWNNKIAVKEGDASFIQIPENIFINCKNLINISSLFSRNTNIYIYDTLFNNSTNIRNVSSIIESPMGAHGRVPLWFAQQSIWQQIEEYHNCYAGMPNTIENYNDITEDPRYGVRI